jgi:hypothetical protein
MILYMSLTTSPHRIDQIVDALIDRKHPFWKDERQAAVYNEASTAAVALQALLLPVVGGVCLLIAGRPAIGIVTAMILTSVLAQGLIMRVLMRRNVQVDGKSWRKDSSPFRKRVGLSVAIFYLACFFWARFHTLNPAKIDGATWAGIVVGGAFVIGAALYASNRSANKNHSQDTGE